MTAVNHILAADIFGVRLIGLTAETGWKLLFSAILILVTFVFGKVLQRILFPRKQLNRAAFIARHAILLLWCGLVLAAFISIWFDDPQRLGTVLGLLAAGVAVALQRVLTAFAGYLLILRGKTFHIGDRIIIGAVRGDVIDLGFLQTTIMEMGQPPGEQRDDPSMWVKARQYSGRVVTVTNARIFDEPVYNYTRDFPYLWEEMTIPVPHHSNHQAAESILLDAARRHACMPGSLDPKALERLRTHFAMRETDLEPRVFWRITDNWLELTVRFLVLDHDIRIVKDAMSRQILGSFAQAGLQIASATYDIVGMPDVSVSLHDNGDSASLGGRANAPPVKSNPRGDKK